MGVHGAMRNTPSPALVISIVALFVALGGTSYAAVKLNGKNIKKGTVSGAALKKNTLTGTQINEARLGKVPSASSADTANSAVTAGDAAKFAGSSPDSFVRGNASVIPANVALAVSTSETLLLIPGLARVNATCTAANTMNIGVVAEADDVTLVMANPRGSTIHTNGATVPKGSGLSYGAASSQKFQISAWKAADPSVYYEIDGGSVDCKVNALAVGRG